jgi:hypothetical protein
VVGMDGYINSGKWGDLNLNTSPAAVKKYNDKQTIIVSFNINPKHVTVTVPVPNNILHGEDVGAYFQALSNTFTRTDIHTKDVTGTFFYKDINLMKDGTFANYNNDRIVFYNSDYLAKDFTGFVCLSMSYLSLCIDILAII